MIRHLRLPCDTLLHGVSYGVLNYLIHCPRPLDEQRTWDFITRPEPALGRFLREAYPPTFMRRLMLLGKQYQDARLGISAHYDVSNEFYKLFLDSKFMFYSCADHLRGNETLVEAQTNKANHLLSLIDPRPGEKIVELGCGWGSMLRHIAQHTGDRTNLTGVTLSKEQAAYVQQFGYNVRLENFVTAEYPREHYDKVYSIGAWEGIRAQEVDVIMQKVYDALKPGGRFVLHFFCGLAGKFPAAVAIAQLFFPGHVAVGYRRHMQAIERAGFRITQQTCHDYRQTLRQWFENLVAQREAAVKIVGVKTYNRYVVFFPASFKFFDDRTGVVFRFVLRKPPIE